MIFDCQLEQNEYDIWLRKLNTRANIPELYVNNLWSLLGPINSLQISTSHAAEYFYRHHHQFKYKYISPS